MANNEGLDTQQYRE